MNISKITLIPLFMSLSLILNGQDQEVKDFFSAFVEEVNNLDETKDVSRAMAFLDEGFTSERTILGPLGTMFHETEDLEAFKFGLAELTVDRGVEAELKISELSVEMNGENAARVKTKISVKLDVDEKMGERSGIDATFLLAMRDDEWKIMRAQIERSVEQRNIGECYCKLLKGDGEYSSEIFYPTGFEYVTNQDLVSVIEDEGDRFISINYTEYPWLGDGTVISLVDDKRTELGMAKTEEDAILAVLGEKYENTCLRLIIK